MKITRAFQVQYGLQLINWSSKIYLFRSNFVDWLKSVWVSQWIETLKTFTIYIRLYIGHIFPKSYFHYKHNTSFTLKEELCLEGNESRRYSFVHKGFFPIFQWNVANVFEQPFSSIHKGFEKRFLFTTVEKYYSTRTYPPDITRVSSLMLYAVKESHKPIQQNSD